MPIDPRIALGVQPMQLPMQDPAAGMNALLRATQISGAMDESKVNALKLQELQRGVTENATLNDLFRGAIGPDGKLDQGAILSGAAQRGLGSKVPGLQKTFAEAETAGATLEKTRAETRKADLEAGIKKTEHVASVLSQATPANYGMVRGIVKNTYGMDLPEQFDPNFIAATVAQGQTLTQKLADEHQRLTLAETGRHNVASEAGTIRGQDMTARTAALGRAQTLKLHNDTVLNENLRAGVGPGGALDENAERTAKAIASGQLPAPTGMALLNPKNQRILGRVMEINPQYDASTVAAKQKAARDFTTGPLGNSMRSFQVAGQHLDQLNELVDALDNRNLQIVNKIGNAYATQTGNPAPTNFEAAKDVVSKEVVKAIVAGGGGVTERQELSHLMSNAKSPKQLKGVIQQYRNLMAAQHDALLSQRRAAGLPDSTLPNYTEAAGGGTAGTSGWSVIDVQPAGK